MGYKVKIPIFEGPFDLLVYLIENAQMSIYDIRISDITGQYLDYIRNLKTQNINLSAEFMVLAAELVEIKSKMMLPRTKFDAGDTLDLEDPRTQLAERLIAYKLCKKQSEFLADRQNEMMGVFEKPQEDISIYLDNPKEFLKMNTEEFIDAFHSFLDRKYRIEKTRKHYSKIERERVTVEERMEYILQSLKRELKSGNENINFNNVIPGKKTRYSAVVSFVSMLQMMRECYIDASQEETYGDILIEAGDNLQDD